MHQNLPYLMHKENQSMYVYCFRFSFLAIFEFYLVLAFSRYKSKLYEKMEKTKKRVVFLYIRYGNFFGLFLEHKVEHKPLIFEECEFLLFDDIFVIFKYLLRYILVIFYKQKL